MSNTDSSMSTFAAIATVGKNCCVNSSATDIFLQHEPQPTATKNMIHLAQSKPIANISHFYIIVFFFLTKHCGLLYSDQRREDSNV